MTEGRAGFRLKFLGGLVLFMFAALTTRLWFLQVLATERYKQEAANNRTRIVRVPAPRGRVLDASGNVLVENRMSLEITVDRQEVGARKEAILARLSELLGVPAETLGQRLDDPRYYVFTPVPVAFDVPKKVAFYISEHEDDFKGVSIVRAPVRTYPEGKLASHALGYLGLISSDQLKDPSFTGYGPNDLVGKDGVEATYEHDLRGTEGFIKYRVNAVGKNLGQIGYQAPRPGNDLVLSLDTTVQQLAEQSLLEGMQKARGILDQSTNTNLKATAGAVVVMDPTTGAVLALASEPTYDPRVFVGGISQAQLDKLTSNASGDPLFNRATQGQYPPGSSYKPFIALSAMQTRAWRSTGGLGPPIASPNGFYDCPAHYTAPGDTSGTVFDNWSPVNLGTISLTQAITISCDTVFYQFGWDYWLKWFHQGGVEPLQHDLGSFGFGRATNVDLPYEHSGRVPTAHWKAKCHKDSSLACPVGGWRPGDLIQMAIGQGDTLVTPLQMASALSAIANDGHYCVPHVGLRIQRPDGTPVRRIKPSCHRKLPFTQAQLAFIKNAMATVPTSGTAAIAFQGFPFSQVSVAGKTGTAQVPPFQDYSWFAAMAPVDNPRYVVVALVEQGGHGSTTAAPIVRSIIEGLFGLPHTGFVNGGVQD